MNIFSSVLIVGRNSKIVSEIRESIPECNIVSHRDIESIELKIYQKIFIFSWSHTSEMENVELISRFPLDRVVFISSIAVLACARRSQWASYPNAKLKCEALVLNAGGKVIRIGVWDQELLKKLPGLVPVTTKNSLLKVMESCLTDKSQIYYPITFQQGELAGIGHNLSNIFNKLSFFVPNVKFIQLPLVVVSRLLGLKNYGYTHDCLYFFCDRVLVGFGAVGSAVSRELNSKGFSHSIVASTAENQFLVTDGFKGTRIGWFKEGLSKLWHGVWISELGGELFEKKVPLLVRRPRLPRCAIQGTVIEFDNRMPIRSIVIRHPRVADVRIFANYYHVAAGVINNVKIFQKTHHITASFSDQEVCVIGDVTTEDLVSRGIIRKLFGVVFGRKVLTGEHAGLSYMLDFRPKAESSIISDAENIYNNRTDQIVFKLLRLFSLALINQAIFNKFGISFDVGKFSVVVQVEAPNCISLKSDGTLSRNRLSYSVYEGIASKISGDFHSFIKRGELLSADAIHLHGGFTPEEYPELYEMVLSGRLYLHGNVLDGSRIGPFHNTIPMIRRETKVIKNVTTVRLNIPTRS